MSGFSELIKNFGRTRDYVRDFFIYGFKVRGDFSRKSSRTYDDERRRIESWLGDCVQYDDSQRGRQIFLTVDSGHILENPLYQAYSAKSFTDNDIRLHFLLLDLLADGESRSLHELTELLCSEYAAVFDEQTVRGKLREYTAEGLIRSEKRGKTAYFSLSPECFPALASEYPGLVDAVRFFSEMQPFGVVGNSILRGEGLCNDCFLMKHSYIVRTLEDELLCKVLDAIETQHYLRLQVFSSRDALNGAQTAHEELCLPLGISTSAQTGRRYLIAYMPAYQHFNALRLDHIHDAKIDAPCEDFAHYMDQLRELLPHVFGVSFETSNSAGEVEPIRVTLQVLPGEEYIPDRIRREMRTGTLEQIGETSYLLTLDILDPREALPWLRTFTGRILSVEGGTEKFREQFRQDLLATAKLYAKEADDDSLS